MSTTGTPVSTSASEPAHQTPRVTVVVMTRNRREDLRRSLPHHTVPVVVVDNGSTDGTPAALRAQFPRVRLVALGRNLGAPARNVGVRTAATPYVALADDDSWWAPGALERAADVLDAHPRLAVLAARILVGREERLDPVCVDMAGSPLGKDPDLPGPNILGFLGCGAVVRRDAFLAAGGFDDVVFFGGEEERLAADLLGAGWGLAYVDEVVAHHYPSGSRDTAGRELLLARNAVLTAVMRRPWPVVLRRARSRWGAGGPGRRGLLAALPRLVRALAVRRPLSGAAEEAWRTVERESAHG